MRARHLRSAVALGVAASAWLCGGAAFGASFVIVVGDAAGEGLNDLTPVLPSGGNPGTTLGDARRRALDQALQQIGCHLDSAVPIVVNATFDALNCNVSSAVVGTAGAASAAKNFPNAPLTETYYPIALANALATVDLADQTPDVYAAFNSNLGSAGCFPSGAWYYGFDGLAPSGTIDFVTIAMHEMVHGLGFHTYVDPATGQRLLDTNDTFMLNLQQVGVPVSSYASMTDAQRITANTSEPNLVFAGVNLVSAFGTPARLYAPDPIAPGSSLNHFAYSELPGELMSPFYVGPTHSLGLAFGALTDSGWRTRSTCAVIVPAPATPRFGAALFAVSLAAAGFLAFGRKRRAKSARS